MKSRMTHRCHKTHLNAAASITSSNLGDCDNSEFSYKKMSPRLILLDRDGVINHDVGAPGVLHPSQLELTSGAATAIADFRTKLQAKIAIITNQSCVGKGLIDERNDLKKIHDKLQKMLLDDDERAVIDKIFYCTSLRNSNDYRMKPNPGMIHEACDYFGIHASHCVMIGDAIRDLEAAASAGVPSRILVETGYGLDVMNGEKAPSCDEENGKLVTFVDDKYCNNLGWNNILVRGQTQWQGAAKSNGDDTNSTFLPFFYAKDLATASSWILQDIDQS